MPRNRNVVQNTKSLPAEAPLSAPTPDMIVRIAQGLLISGRGMAVFAPDDSICLATEGFRALYDMQPGPQTFDSLMRHCWQTGRGPRIETQDIDAWLAKAKTRRRSEPVREFEVDMVDGRWFWISEATLPDGWMILSVANITSVKRREFRLTTDRDAAITAAETDHLTGLFNRGATMKRFNALVDHATGTNDIFSAVLIDLDHFKSINDRFGHDAGDQVLVHFATSAAAALRERDIIGRVGGEEFLILMPGANLKQSCAVIERLQAHLRDQRIAFGGVTLRYTFSAGVAQWYRGLSPDQLYREADQALYAAKDAGRNLIGRAG
ncbi:MAG: diguanylate cyclase [Asticcacaulis sp.]|uniref:sensor domain-containing diguanylate cyclase n=1 Tax=Asticcacaulis sp. TaxID=1872648 RepID=UPI0039E465F4